LSLRNVLAELARLQPISRELVNARAPMGHD
jgi:hypothetical protein